MTALFVIATITIFLTVDWFLTRRKEHAAVLSAVTVKPVSNNNPVRLPEGIFFAPSHTWLNLFPSGKVRIGIDDFVLRMTNKPEITFLKRSGDLIAKGEPMMRLRDDGHELTVYSPIEGAIESANDELINNPDLLKQSLFQNGWSFVIKPKHTSDLRQFILGSESRMWIQREFGRLRDLLATMGKSADVSPVYLQDGGPPIANAMEHMDEYVWKQFEQEFLQIQ
jgi:glycine cleavage system H protein